MKNHRKKVEQATSRREVQRALKPPLSRSRLWLFRFAALLLPVLLLALFELALHIGGYGYATSFFRKTRVDGQEFLVNSDTFTLRFFPPQLARWPEPFMIPTAKPPNTVRIFVFGESAAMGDPQPAFSAARYLEVLLQERFPTQHFEVINLGITAINSHVILPIAQECARRGAGDIWIIYMGNNEMVGPFGAATIFGSQAPPLTAVRLNLALQKARLGQLAMATLRKLGGQSANSTWDGMRMFLQNQILPDDPRRASVYRNFEANLREILHAGLDSGAKVILNTMSVNLKDCPPFASLGNSNQPALDRAQFGKLFAEGLAREKAGDGLAAAQAFEQAAQLDPKFAELQYRWADCLRRASNATARTHYQLACDADALPFRADTQVNGIIRRVGGELAGRGLLLSDAESALDDASPSGIAGQEVFFEHVHFSFRGNYLLGRLWAEQVVRALPSTLTATNVNDWASQETCERDLGLTLWSRGFVIDLVIGRMQRPPLNNQFNNPERLARFQAESEALHREQSSTNAIFRNGEELLRAILRYPQDHWLHEGLAGLYESLGDLKRALAAYRKVHELLPDDYYARLQLGRILGKVGQPAEGESLLRQAARQRPSLPEVWSELGYACLAQKKYAAALEAFERAAQCKPSEASYASGAALALARLNRRAEAIATYRRAIQLRPDFWETHFELAGELAADNLLEEAAREYTEAIRLNSRHAVSRINLGVVLFRQNRLDEAIKQFEAALQIEPTNAAATDYLRQVTERRNQRK